MQYDIVGGHATVKMHNFVFVYRLQELYKQDI